VGGPERPRSGESEADAEKRVLGDDAD